MSVSVIDFGGKLTPDQILLNFLERSSTSKIVVVAMLDADDYIVTGASNGSALQKLGMVEILRARLVRSIEDEE